MSVGQRGGLQESRPSECSGRATSRRQAFSRALKTCRPPERSGRREIFERLQARLLYARGARFGFGASRTSGVTSSGPSAHLGLPG
eukprot:9829640-Alexandrium_andersonii.AAC.1